MADVKWIKLSTDIFNNRKIRMIEALPDGDAVIVIWLKLLTLAGGVNDHGFIYFTQDIPYTEQMLATEFGRPLSTVQLALKTFQSFGMIEIVDDIIHVSNWEKYQNVDGMDKIREQTRLRVQKHRENQKLLCNVTGNVTVTHGNATDIDKEIEIDRDKYILSAKTDGIPTEKVSDRTNVIIDYLNLKTGKKYKKSTAKTRALIQARLKEGFTVDDFKTVIDKKTAEWKDSETMEQYLRPDTLFGTKFEGYLNQRKTVRKGPQGHGFIERDYLPEDYENRQKKAVGSLEDDLINDFPDLED